MRHGIFGHGLEKPMPVKKVHRECPCRGKLKSFKAGIHFRFYGDFTIAIFLSGLFRGRSLGEDILDGMSMHIGEAAVRAVVIIGQLFVIETE